MSKLDVLRSAVTTILINHKEKTITIARDEEHITQDFGKDKMTLWNLKTRGEDVQKTYTIHYDNLVETDGFD